MLEPADDPVPRASAVNLDSVESVAVAVLVERIGRLSDVRMRQICAALEVAVDCQRLIRGTVIRGTPRNRLLTRRRGRARAGCGP